MTTSDLTLQRGLDSPVRFDMLEWLAVSSCLSQELQSEWIVERESSRIMARLYDFGSTLGHVFFHD